MPGKVRYAGYTASTGNYLVLSVTGSDLDLVYMHMLKTPLVSSGQMVSVGQLVAFSSARVGLRRGAGFGPSSSDFSAGQVGNEVLLCDSQDVQPHLLLVPSFTELEWGIKPALEQWADLASFDGPGIGANEIPFEVDIEPSGRAQLLSLWRDGAAKLALEAVDRQGWERFLVVTDSYGAATAVRIAKARRDAVLGLALGHAALSHATEGERAPERAGVSAAMVQLSRQGSRAFVQYGIAQLTRGGVDEQTAQQMVERFPDMDLVTAMLEALAQEPEPIGDDLAGLDVPLLLAKHDGCLGSTDEGFEDIVAAFPEADTVICPEMCASSPAFAEALRDFCAKLAL